MISCFENLSIVFAGKNVCTFLYKFSYHQNLRSRSWKQNQTLYSYKLMLDEREDVDREMETSSKMDFLNKRNFALYNTLYTAFFFLLFSQMML